MKNIYAEKEEAHLGRKPKRLKVNHILIEKVGKTLYHIDGVKNVKIQVGMNSGSIISYSRSENDDEFEDYKKRSEEE